MGLEELGALSLAIVGTFMHAKKASAGRMEVLPSYMPRRCPPAPSIHHTDGYTECNLVQTQSEWAAARPPAAD
jgi:hypothetical protein